MNSPCLGRKAFVCGKRGTGRPELLYPQGLDSTEHFKTELFGLAAAGSPQEHLYLPDLGGVERRTSAGGAEEAKSGRGKSEGSGIRTVGMEAPAGLPHGGPGGSAGAAALRVENARAYCHDGDGRYIDIPVSAWGHTNPLPQAARRQRAPFYSTGSTLMAGRFPSR